MYSIGVDLGGTNIAVGLVTEAGEILYKDSCPTGVGRPYEEILRDMGQLILRVIEHEGKTPADIDFIGVGSPGVSDPETGEIVFANNLYWHHVPVRGELQRYIDKPVYINNDANVAALAEFKAGACRGVRNSVTITLGTGVGSGLIINGQLYAGSHNVGAELGHMIIDLDGIQCNCCNKGCFERYTAATALIREGRRVMFDFPDSLIGQKAGRLENISAKTVIDSAREGDFFALDIFKKYVHTLAMGIINLINLLDPDIIAIGGGVAAAGDFLLEPLRAEVAEHIYFKDLPYARIVPAQLGNDAGIVGAAMLGRI